MDIHIPIRGNDFYGRDDFLPNRRDTLFSFLPHELIHELYKFPSCNKQGALVESYNNGYLDVIEIFMDEDISEVKIFFNHRDKSYSELLNCIIHRKKTLISAEIYIWKFSPPHTTRMVMSYDQESNCILVEGTSVVTDEPVNSISNQHYIQVTLELLRALEQWHLKK